MKLLSFGAEARRAIRSALADIGRLLRPTLGPLGRTVLVQDGRGPRVLSSGYGLLKELEFPDRPRDTIVRLIRDAARRQHETAGDGIVTALVLTEAIVGRLLRRVEAGEEPVELCRRLRDEAARAARQLRRMALPVDTPTRLKEIAWTAVGFDRGLASTLQETLEPLSRGAAAIVEETDRLHSSVRFVEGIQIPAGYVSAHLVNRKETMQAMMEEPLVLVHDRPISDVRSLAGFLEKVAPMRRPLLLFVGAIDADPIAALVLNQLRGTLASCAVRVASPDTLEDLASLCGATRSPDGRLDPSSLGSARRAVVDSVSTTIWGGAGDTAALAAHLRRRLEREDLSIADREALQERVGRLSGGLVQIQAGGASPAEMKLRRIALHGGLRALQGALRGGAVPGAGHSLFRAADALPEDSAMRSALTAPMEQLLANSGLSPASRPADPKQVYDAAAGRWRNPIEAGILDPLPVVQGALETAVSLASILLTSEAILSEAAGPIPVVVPPNIEEAARSRRR
jgi:chaperonin GroEL